MSPILQSQESSLVPFVLMTDTPRPHEVSVRDVTAMTDEELIDRIRVLDDQLG